MILTIGDIITVLRGAGINCFPRFGDTEYTTVASMWVEHQFSDALTQAIAALKIEYSVAWDCNAYADFVHVYARIHHSNTSNRPQAALGLGVLWYVRDDGRGAHAINLFFDVVNVQPAVRFYEPQLRLCTALSATEKLSVYFVGL